MFEFQVKLFDALNGGSLLGTTALPQVPVTNGVFNLRLDLGAESFNGADRWLEIGVRTNGSVEAFTSLLPRQAVTREPYAIFANTAGSAVQLQSGGTTAIRSQGSAIAHYGPNLLGGSPANSAGPGAGSSTVLGGLDFYPNFVNSLDSMIGGGFGNSIFNGADNGFIGSAILSTVGTNAGYGFIGSGSLHVLEGDGGAIVGGRYGRIQSGAHYSFIGGGDGNWIQSNSSGGAIVGGNANVISNDVASSIVGGGYYNRIGAGASWSGLVGGTANVIGQNADHAFVGGGEQNVINQAGTYSVIGGGYANSILFGSRSGFIGGGEENTIGLNQYGATIGGGILNTNLGYAATVPGGYNNTAAGHYSLAAGTRARALHTGAFVWSDSQNTDFASTNVNEFAVRAGGGVRLETAGAGVWVDGAEVLTGTVTAQDLADGSITGDKIAPGAISTTELSAGAVTAGAIAPGAVDGGRIANGAVVRSLNGLQDNMIIAAGDGVSLTTNGHTLTLQGSGWQLNGNRFLSNSFLGSTDNSPVNFRVGNQLALRLTPGTDTNSPGFPNVIGGSAYNVTGNGVSGATVAGGGGSLFFAQGVGSSFGTVGGGFANRILSNSALATVAGGMANQVGDDSSYSVIGGGAGNSALAILGVVAGGDGNQIGLQGLRAVVSGGNKNLADATTATVAGGFYNQISTGATGAGIAGGTSNQVIASVNATILGGKNNSLVLADNSAVLGGLSNSATAAYALAAGTQARAVHQGAFVWSCPTEAPIRSKIENEFVARATGGFRLITTAGIPVEDHIELITNYTSIPVPAGTAGAVEVYTCIEASFDPLNQYSHSGFACGYGPGGPYPDQSGYIPNGGGILPGFSGPDTRLTNYVLFTGTNVESSTVYGDSTFLHGVVLESGAGSWSDLSDRNAKTNFSEVNESEVLEKIVSLPITTWNYRGQQASIRHLGPVAQDFYAAFNLGSNDKTITTTDEQGVALAAIKGLNQKLGQEVRKLEEQSKAKDAKITSLEQRLLDLEQVVRRLGEK